MGKRALGVIHRIQEWASAVQVGPGAEGGAGGRRGDEGGGEGGEGSCSRSHPGIDRGAALVPRGLGDGSALGDRRRDDAGEGDENARAAEDKGGKLALCPLATNLAGLPTNGRRDAPPRRTPETCLEPSYWPQAPGDSSQRRQDGAQRRAREGRLARRPCPEAGSAARAALVPLSVQQPLTSLSSEWANASRPTKNWALGQRTSQPHPAFILDPRLLLLLPPLLASPTPGFVFILALFSCSRRAPSVPLPRLLPERQAPIGPSRLGYGVSADVPRPARSPSTPPPHLATMTQVLALAARHMEAVGAPGRRHVDLGQQLKPPAGFAAAADAGRSSSHIRSVPSRKRASTIHTIDADRGMREPLDASTPGAQGQDGASDIICLCTPAPKIPRPRNGE